MAGQSSGPVKTNRKNVTVFLSGEEKRKLVNPDILASGDYRTRDLFYDLYKKAPALDHLLKIQYLDINTYLCDDILTKVDRASMMVLNGDASRRLDYQFFGITLLHYVIFFSILAITGIGGNK